MKKQNERNSGHHCPECGTPVGDHSAIYFMECEHCLAKSEE
ncbi:hypothetical protein SAMN05421743_102178 [Thalassobacillus cyri]|uniref:YhfH-like protein n=1 Tax=Thalassobacillus cyri TaxID=571932 RepID=A0A1H3XKI3_9BACI|nr:hypothetical protein [Thalassobacillus cyri]SDZ99856.1 hypothetical protein SAMN05421743_102178 [Thalassobacillus cyri]